MKEKLPEAIHLRGFKECMEYHPETGRLVWKKKFTPRSHQVVLGGEVGNLRCGYRQVTLVWGGKSRSFQVHRIAWYLHYGEWPPRNIDHINRDRADNRISNLRLGDQPENLRNKSMQKNNTTGYQNVQFHSEGRYRAVVRKNHLGYFPTAEEASFAVEEYRRVEDGEFYYNPSEQVAAVH